MKISTLIKTYFWILPLLVFLILTVAGALAHPLWGDEAETALFARNILKYGVPKGWDGTNIMGINNAVVLDKHLVNHTSPWGQYYLAAASFLVFGQSSFTARLPFIILAVAALLLLYSFALHLFGKREATLTIWILSLSPAFILFAYQTRYYSITIFAGVLLAFSTALLLEKRFVPKLLFVLAGVIFFYANYVSFAAFFASNFISFLIFFLMRKKPAKYIRNYIGWYIFLSLIIASFCLPWYLSLKPFESRGELSFTVEMVKYLPQLLLEGYAQYNFNNAFPILFALFSIVYIIWKAIRKRLNAQFLLIFLIPTIYLCFMAIFTLVSMVDTSFTSHRYTVVVFPFFALSVAYIIFQIWNYKKIAGLIVLVLLIFTNVFTLQKVQSYLILYLTEVTNSYPTPDKVVADYLTLHARKGDTAFVNLDRDHEPLIFHLKDTIKFVNRVSLINTRIFPENRSVIPRYIYSFRDEPDWVILYSKRGNDGTFFTFDNRDVPPEINLQKDYEETVLPVFFSDMSRPELDSHSFTEVQPEGQDFVYVYKLKK